MALLPQSVTRPSPQERRFPAGIITMGVLPSLGFLLDMIYEHIVAFEALLGSLMMAWGIWLLLPHQTFATNTVYRIFETLGPYSETIFGSVTLIAGILQLMAIRLPTSHALCTLISGICAFIWVVVVGEFWFASPYSTAIPTYSILAVWHILVFMSLSRPERGRQG